MLIRRDTPADTEAIGRLITEAFATARRSSGHEAAIVAALRASDALTLSLVAEDQGKIIGYVAFSPIVVDDAMVSWFGLGPVSVLPPRQRQGIGVALIERGLSNLRDASAKGCVVLGDPNYYGKFGFRNDPGLRYGETGIHFQRLVFVDPVPKGEVRYHIAFDVGRV